MMKLTAAEFRDFYVVLNGYDPFPWQQRLATSVCEGDWPKGLDLPTATGKTSCIDIALFAMALRGRGPRRIFYVVDRRIVVDQAFDHMREIAAKLREAKSGILATVAARLRQMAGAAETEDPVVTYQMRGGIYRDDSWVRSPLQPMLIASTVDQIGSRLLFRGYGVWDKTLPIHAALAANDALILLDEAHCSKAFAQTLERMEQYRTKEWAEQDLNLPFAFVEMTATPARECAEPFRLSPEDLTHPVLRPRLFASKPAKLVISKAKLKDYDKLAADLVGQAVELAAQPGLRRVAIMVNRVRTARIVYELLNNKHRAHLLIGRMRPIDRTLLHADIDDMRSGKDRKVNPAEPVFVVATQCLEVGADLDFDALVTECAGIDALLQRFGRLDRIGNLRNQGITAEGRILAGASMTDTKYRDAVYQGSLANTWQWLSSAVGEPDFAIYSDDGNRTVRERLVGLGAKAQELKRESPSAPILLPTHLDAFAQTSPKPALDPDPQLFLHGKETGSPDVQVVWRADLDPAVPTNWADIVALCPPVAAEAMSVPLYEFLWWATKSNTADTIGSDLQGTDVPPTDEGHAKRKAPEMEFPLLRWRGDESDIVKNPNELRPGDTLILSEVTGGWNDLGHIPPGNDIDVAERARHALRRGWTLRLFPKLMERWPTTPQASALIALAADPDAQDKDLVEALKEYRSSLPDDHWLAAVLAALPSKFSRPEMYPSPDGMHIGWVLSGRFAEADSGQDESSSSEPVRLDDHLGHVCGAVERFSLALIDDPELRKMLAEAARSHDCGKADSRFQALLHGGDPFAAQFAPCPLAKGKLSRPSPGVRQMQWTQSGLPRDFRHELVSLALIRQNSHAGDDELILHLVASHHGRCRPFAPVVANPKEVAWNGWSLTRDQAAELAAHRLQNGVSDRFWNLTRRYGWWGLVYLETLLRLADWQASASEVNS